MTITGHDHPERDWNRLCTRHTPEPQAVKRRRLSYLLAAPSAFRLTRVIAMPSC